MPTNFFKHDQYDSAKSTKQSMVGTVHPTCLKQIRMAALGLDDVKKVAQLANLELSETELQEMSKHLSGILDYVEVLNQVDTEQIEPLAHPIEVVNVFREDEPTAMLPREEALKNAPETDGKYFVVPAILNSAE